MHGNKGVKQEIRIFIKIYFKEYSCTTVIIATVVSIFSSSGPQTFFLQIEILEMIYSESRLMLSLVNVIIRLM